MFKNTNLNVHVWSFSNLKHFWKTTNLYTFVHSLLRHLNELEDFQKCHSTESRLLKLWDWHEQLSNPQFSSCWICLLLLTHQILQSILMMKGFRNRRISPARENIHEEISSCFCFYTTGSWGGVWKLHREGCFNDWFSPWV